MIRFAIKGALATAAVYYTAEQGVWKDSDTTSELYTTIKSHACPLMKQASEQLPFELPTLPKSDNVSHIVRVYWNSGVKNVFTFILDSPIYIRKWSKSSYEYFESFANPPSVGEAINENK